MSKDSPTIHKPDEMREAYEAYREEKQESEYLEGMRRKGYTSKFSTKDTRYEIIIVPLPGCISYALMFQGEVVVNEIIHPPEYPTWNQGFPDYNLIEILSQSKYFNLACDVARRANGNGQSKRAIGSKKQCNATNSKGNPCKNYRMKGYDKCVTHNTEYLKSKGEKQ